MGFFSSDPKWVANPNAQGLMDQYRDYGNSVGLGMAGKIAKKGLKQWSQGNYDSGIVGSLLAPLRDQYSTMQRESNRAYGMGALGLASSSQPALMARLKQLNEDKIGEQMGHAYAQAVPGLFGQLSNVYGDARNTRINAEMGALGGQMQAANMGQWVSQPSFLQKLSGLAGLGGQIAGLAMGIPGLGGGGAAGGGGGGFAGFTPAQYSAIGAGMGMR